jgi:hypothetical protein
MKFFIDTEFIEGFHKPLFGKKRHFIDLISIGIICEDGREYYAISNEFDPADADEWVRNNVLGEMYNDLLSLENRKRSNLGIKMLGDFSGQYTNKDFKYLLKVYGKSNTQIAEEICAFIDVRNEQYPGPPASYKKPYVVSTKDIEFYAYYADYDWVLFCSLFGRMIDLPKGFPMYCRDLKQSFDEHINSLSNIDFLTHFHEVKPLTFEEKMKIVKEHNPKYPKQFNEHSAIDDARWNFKLYKFLNAKTL